MVVTGTYLPEFDHVEFESERGSDGDGGDASGRRRCRLSQWIGVGRRQLPQDHEQRSHDQTSSFNGNFIQPELRTCNQINSIEKKME